MFVDIHSHILPNVDDGAKDMEMTLNMLKMAEAEGIRSIIATPHYITGYNHYNNDELQKAYIATQQIIKAHKINIALYLGNEIAIEPDTVQALKTKSAEPLAGSQYILLELPAHWQEAILEQLLYEIELSHYRIVLAHIERYERFVKQPELLSLFIERGCLTQLNASSIVSKDRKVRVYSQKLIKRGFVHTVGTDAHSNRRRKPAMKEAFEVAKGLIGEKANDLFIHNGQKIIHNEIIQLDEPMIHKKKFFIF